MKFEFRPEFKFLIKLEALRPKLRGLLLGFKFDPENGGESKRKIISILSVIILAVLIAVALIKVLSAAE
jgi:hypothetical protein